MSDRRDPMLDLAEAVTDGRAVDWNAEVADKTPTTTAGIRALELVERIAMNCRSLGELTLTTGPRLRADDSLPSTWGPLARLELVGKGSFGDVFRAWDPRLQRTVALKLLRRIADSNSDLAERVLQEGRLLARVRHPNVAVVYAVEEHDGRVGTWMEFVEGATLDAIVRSRGPFGAQEAAVVGVELCRALAAVHGAGLLHRDVKAQNVMREAGGRIVLMDFGAGLDIEAPRGHESVSGTPLYMAPEVLEGESASVESDLYAVGVLLFYLATGSFPVRADTMSGLRRAHAAGERRRLRDLRPDIPAGFASVVQTAIAPSPEARFRTAGALEEALSATLKERVPDSGAVVVPMATPAAPRHRIRVGWAQGALAAAVVVAVIAVLLPRWLGTSSSPSGVPSGSPDRSQAENHRLSDATLPDAGHATRPAPAFEQPKVVDASPKEEIRARQPDPLARPPETVAADPSPLPAGKLDARATLFRDREGSRERLLDGEEVSIGDSISLDIDSPEPVHVYIVHEDDRRNPTVLFPIPGFVPSNPVPAGPQRLPGTKNGKAIDWGVDSAAGHERILVLMSRKPLTDLDAALVASQRPSMGSRATTADERSEVNHPTRGMGRLVERPDTGSAQNVFELAKTLVAHPPEANEIWVREYGFRNKGR